MKIWVFFLLLITSVNAVCQEDTLDYTMYKDKYVWYADLGFRAAPFNIKYDFPNSDLNRLNYKHNFTPIGGVGFSYKWFGLRIGFSIPSYMRSVNKYGRSKFTGIGLKFNIKQTFWDIDYRVNTGYAIKQGPQLGDTSNVYGIRNEMQTAGFSINSWYFRSKNYRMQPVLGIVGDFKRSSGTWYFKWTLNLFGVGNGQDSTAKSIIPKELIDTTETVTRASVAYAFDIGLVPGYAYTHRHNNWQASVFGGLGGVIQTKSYSVKNLTRGFIGLAPRVDLRFVGGYSTSKYFCLFVTEFDIKSINFRDTKYTQTFYSLQVMGGIRLDKKKKKKKSND